MLSYCKKQQVSSGLREFTGSFILSKSVGRTNTQISKIVIWNNFPQIYDSWWQIQTIIANVMMTICILILTKYVLFKMCVDLSYWYQARQRLWEIKCLPRYLMGPSLKQAVPDLTEWRPSSWHSLWWHQSNTGGL